jgi:hypothetical protein
VEDHGLRHVMLRQESVTRHGSDLRRFKGQSIPDKVMKVLGDRCWTCDCRLEKQTALASLRKCRILPAF